MPNATMAAVVAHIRRSAGPAADGPSATDGPLLSRFIASRDEESFATLVTRHGPMVLAVCRRVAGDPHLAEDAFQASFLVLARRAADVRPRATVRAWLYGVAVRSAREARAMSARRRAREVPVPRVPERPAPARPEAEPEALRALDEEVARLPDHLRAAVVLCELDGLSRRQAAVRLGIPEGTLSSRLAAARKRLGARLRERGMFLSAAGLSALTCPHALSAVPAALSASAARLARSGPVAAGVAELAREVSRTMLLSKLNGVMTVGLVVAACLAGLATGVLCSAWADGTTPQAASAAPDGPAPVGPGTILFGQFGPAGGKYFVTDPGGKVELPLDLPAGARGVSRSPDGRTLAYWTGARSKPPAPAALYVRPTDGEAPTRFRLPFEFGFLSYAWSPRGDALLLNVGVPGARGVGHLRVNLESKKVVPVNLLGEYLVTDWAPDGDSFLATAVGRGDRWQPRALRLLRADDGTPRRQLAEPKGWAVSGRLCPDGKRALCVNDQRLFVIDLARPGVLNPVAGVPEGAEVTSHAWAPDGKRIVYTTGSSVMPEPEELKQLESRLVVCDPDGKSATVLRAVKGKCLTGVDWR